MPSSTVKSDIRAFLFRHVAKVALQDSDDIFALGLVNSLFAMQLVEFTQRHFGIEIGPEDLEMTNFRSIDAIAGLVARKAGGEVAP